MDAVSGFVRIRYTDPYTFEEWRTVVEELRRDHVFAFQRRIGGLADRTRAGAPDEEFMEAVAAYIAAHPLVVKGRRVAFVARETESAAAAWRHARMYEEAGAISTVFSGESEAEAWLREGIDAEELG